jgi:membrane protease YdiL (CAAX protease family)
MSPARRSRWRALLRGVAVVPAWLRLLALRLVAGLLWLPAWFGALVLGRPPRWWRRYGWYVVTVSARVRAYAWLLTDRPPRQAATLLPLRPPPAGRIPRRSLLARLFAAPWYLLLRYFVAVFAALFAFASWWCLVIARRHPERLRGAQWSLQAFATDIDCWLMLVSPARPRLPEPDPRLRPGIRSLGDHAPLPPFKRKTGLIAIGVDLVGGLLVSGLFYDASSGGAVDLIWLVFVADLAIQFLGPYLGIYLASQSGPLTVAQFGLHAIRPLRSLGWAALLIAVYAVLLGALVLLLAPFLADTSDGGGLVPDGSSTAWTIAFVALGTVMAPMFEEFFYRGFIFQALRQGRGTWGAALVSSLAFAAAHYDFAPLAIADRALIGIGLCWLFARTGRLLPGMFAHSINNAIVLPLAIGWDWQIAIVLPVSLLVIASIATVVSHRRGEWAPT